MSLAFYCLLFTAVGVGFIFVHLVAGKLVRPNRPGTEKKTIYECGEPTIGSAWIQFDLRFYVVALLFVIFDVEVAFFFPWAEVFGKANDVAALQKPTAADKDHPTEAEMAAYRDYCKQVLALTPPHYEPPHHLRDAYQRLADVRSLAGFESLRDERNQVDLDLARKDNPVGQAGTLAWMAFFDMLVFFGVLLVGFAYLWRRGDLAWVRSVAAERTPPAPPAPEPAPARPAEPALTTPVSAH